MIRVAIISPSVRKGRKSHRVALYLERAFSDSGLAESEILDLLTYRFPLFDERLKYQEKPSHEAIDFSERIKKADGVVIVAPEYNGAPPASLKNVIDLLTDEWYRKPVAFVTVSDGSFAGTQAILSLQFSLWKLGALTLPSTLRFPSIGTTFSEDGIPDNKQSADKRVNSFLNDLLWFIEAKKRMSD